METSIEAESYRPSSKAEINTHPRKSNWPMMFAIGFLVGLDFLQSSMVSLSSAHIRGGVNASPEEFVWTTAIYAVTIVIVILNQQHLTSWLGYRRYLTLSLLVDAVGCYACARADSVPTLIFGRFIQALGVGGLFTSSRILLQISFEGTDMGKALSYFGYVSIAIVALAPLLASIILKNGTWDWIFLAPIPFILAAAILVYLTVPSRNDPKEKELEAREDKIESRSNYDYWPIALFSLAIIAGQTILLRVQFEYLSQSPALVAMLGVVIGALILFGWHQWRSGQPTLHLRGLHLSRSFRWGLAFYAIYYLLTYSFSYMYPIYTEQVLGFSAELTGRLLFFSNLMSLVSVFIVIQFGGYVANRKWLMCSGLLLIAVTTWLLARMSPGISAEKLYLPLALYGLSGILLIFPVAGMTFQEFDHESFGHAYRVKNIVRQLCNTCGVAAMTSIFQHREVVHRGVVNENLSQYNVAFTQRLDTLTSALNGRGLNAADAKSAALVLIDRAAEHQIMALSCFDIFLIITCGAVLSCGLILCQNRLK